MPKAAFPWRRTQPTTTPLIVGNTTSVTPTLFALNSAMASGAGWGFTFIAQETGDLTDVWVVPSLFTGTWTATDQAINCEIRLGLVATNRPGSTVVGSPFTIPIAQIDGSYWVRKSGLSIPVTQGVMYSMIFGDADGNATNYVQMVNSVAGGSGTAVISSGMSTVNGWATGAGVANGPCALFKVAGKMYGGAIHAGALIPHTSSTRKRGNKITVSTPVVFTGFVQVAGIFQGNTAGPWILVIFKDEQGPVVTADYVYSFPNGASPAGPVPLVYTIPIPDQYVLWPGHVYRIVVRPTASSTAPSMMPTYSIQTADEADITSLFAPDGITCCSTEETAGATWLDWPQRVTQLGIMLQPLPGATIRG